MLNLLIVTLANNSLSGGSVASRSNFEAFRDTGVFNISVVGPSELDYATHPYNISLSTFQKLLSYAKLRPAINFSEIVREIDAAGFPDMDVVFFDSSLLGPVTTQLRKRFPHALFVMFFHNIESVAYLSMMKRSSPLAWTRFFSIFLAERLSTKNSDYRITLSHSDSTTLVDRLGATADIIWPITYPAADLTFYENPIGDEYVLFVGGYYKPNLDAIDYLAERIVPHIRKKIVVAGFNLRKIKEKYATVANFIVLDSPANLAPLYQYANLVLAPIFTGGGIKTKIIEAFSYGKFVVSSPEAAVGFENIPTSCIFIANSDADYVAQINGSVLEPLRFEIVTEFEKHYSARAKGKLLQKLTERIITHQRKK